jgi:hypothetical protein
MEVKGSPFSLRIGKDIKETRPIKSEAFKAGRASRIKHMKNTTKKSSCGFVQVSFRSIMAFCFS